MEFLARRTRVWNGRRYSLVSSVAELRTRFLWFVPRKESAAPNWSEESNVATLSPFSGQSAKQRSRAQILNLETKLEAMEEEQRRQLETLRNASEKQVDFPSCSIRNRNIPINTKGYSVY
jgi:hypothetical protein